MMSSGGELFKSSMVQRMVWNGGCTGGSNAMSGSSRLAACAKEQEAASTKMPTALSSSSVLFPRLSSGLIPEVNSAATSPESLHGGQEISSMPESWSQLLLGGLAGDHESYGAATALLSKGLEEGPMAQAASAYDFHGHGEEIHTSAGGKAQLSQMFLASSSPRSCVTTSLGSSVLDFSKSAPAPEPTNHQSDNSSESNSNANGSAPKKARVQASSTAQSTLKVRKERLGDRVTALHQLVSPFGKTDTASVLQETVGYIRFLLGQIEALSYPYLLVHGTEGSMQQQTGAKDGEDGAGKKDYLRSRGLCLVPVSCMSYLAADNTSDFWSPAAPLPPPPLGGIILR